MPASTPPTAPHTRVTLTPAAGFCVKSTTTHPAVLPVFEPAAPSASSSSPNAPPKARPQPVESGSKVFVNIAWDPNVPAPPPGNEEAIQRAMHGEDELDEWNAQGWFVPVVVSEPRLDKDKAGKPSLVFDCVFNTSIKSRTIRDIGFKTFIVELALQRVEAQSRLTLSRTLATPNIASKGKLTPRSVLIPNFPVSSASPPSKKLIEEIDASAPSPAPTPAGPPKGILKNASTSKASLGLDGNASAASASKADDGLEVPAWRWTREESASRTVITVDIPRFTRAHHATTTLDITPRSLTLHVPALYTLALDLALPDAAIQASFPGPRAQAALGLKRTPEFDVEGASAEWRVADGVLVVSV